MKPTHSILSPKFVYKDSAHTDLRKTFNRIRKEQSEARRAEEERKREAEEKVRTLTRKHA